jgi:hypothetical protein
MAGYKGVAAVSELAERSVQQELAHEEARDKEEWARREAENARLRERVASLEAALVELNGADWWKELEGPDPRWSHELGRVM